MDKEMERPKPVESVFHHSDGFNPIKRGKEKKRAKSFSEQGIVSEEPAVIISTKGLQPGNLQVKKRFGLNQVTAFGIKIIKSIIGSKDAQRGFFYAEEQRKFKLTQDYRKRWPHELLNYSYIQRRDL